MVMDNGGLKNSLGIFQRIILEELAITCVLPQNGVVTASPQR